MAQRTCSICGTGGIMRRGWCNKHWKHWRKYGDPLWCPPVPPDLPGEWWLPVVGFEGLYDISNLARVRSLPRNTTLGRILRQNRTGKYLSVMLSENNVPVRRMVHDLVAAAFLGPRPPGQEVRHGPNGRLDNRASQLCYGTRAQQTEDMIRDGTRPRGETHGSAKLTAEIVSSIRIRAAAGESQAAMAREFGVTTGAVSLAIRGITWRHLP